MRALIVDDSKSMRMILGRVLKEIGFQVTEAGDGREALARLNRGEEVDLMLVDWNMSVMDGVEMLTRLKANPELRSLPVIMLTAESGREHVLRIAKLGVRDYVVKPFKEEMIVERVGRMVDLKARNEAPARAKRFDDPLQILVADDKPAIIEQIRDCLAGTPWKVSGVGQPGQAVDSCSLTLPDVILISLSLPENSGFTLFQMLRANAHTKAVPILALSVKTAADEQTRAKEVGFTSLVCGPHVDQARAPGHPALRRARDLLWPDRVGSRVPRVQELRGNQTLAVHRLV
jgi:two-component system cell cycle response regulator